MTDEPVILCCARVIGPLLIADNLTGPCAECGFKVQYRPHAPKNHVLRCMECMFDLIEPGDEIGTTNQMLNDAERFFKGKRQ